MILYEVFHELNSDCYPVEELEIHCNGNQIHDKEDKLAVDLAQRLSNREECHHYQYKHHSSKL